MAIHSTIQLEACRFMKEEMLLLEHATLRATVFRYRSGVCAVRLTNPSGNVVILPYQGQQIWSMEFAGRSLAMKSIFDEPRSTQDFLSTYGGFLQHCGMTAMGNPGPDDDHPVHGELPNAPYQQAFIRAGSDDCGAYLEIGGIYRHSIAFTCDYKAEPTIRLYESGTTVHISMQVTNLRAAPMEYMYLSHLNFRPEDYGRLVYSAPCAAGRVQLRPGKVNNAELMSEYAAFIERVKQDPSIMNTFDPEHILNPELLLYYQYTADREGWAHSLYIQPDGFAGYVKHRPEQLDKVVRWIVRTGDEEALGLALPATATPDGYTLEKQKGNIRLLPSKCSVLFQMEAGLLSPEQAEIMEKHITETLRLHENS